MFEVGIFSSEMSQFEDMPTALETPISSTPKGIFLGVYSTTILYPAFVLYSMLLCVLTALHVGILYTACN